MGCALPAIFTNLMNRFLVLLFLLPVGLSGCLGPSRSVGVSGYTTPFIWKNANVYFLLTDRFNNGDPTNDTNFDRTAKPALLRGFLGGDLKGISEKIRNGYFDRLGVTALWCTPVMEQTHGPVDEGTGLTYGFHGYWTRDWTRLDPNFGTESDLAELVDLAHQHGIRVVFDVVINHTGPVTAQDPVWPDNWVRTTPQCTYQDYASTVTCTLVKNLPDIKTENSNPVDLPASLLEKWKREGRLEQELAELDAFFARTGYPRAPRYYIIKWLTDYVRKYGLDGYRCDTAKHIEETAWAELRREADIAFSDWKKANPAKVLDNNDFYMVGEVYNYNISAGRLFDFGDKKVDFFNQGFNSLINFELKSDANNSYEAIFSKYSMLLQNQLRGKSVLNYLSSHDDGGPFDKARARPIESGTKLLLCPGAAQIYYGDETNRPLDIPGTQGDATLRSFMNWDELIANTTRNGFATRDVLAHWQKLGRFRKAHPAVGAGVHTMISQTPYCFKRVYTSANFTDQIVVGLDLPAGRTDIPVRGIFPDGATIQDYYSGRQLRVQAGKITVEPESGIVLLGK